MVSSHLTIIIRYFSGPLLRNVHWGGKSRQKGQFLLNHVALCFNASCCVVCPNRKIIAFRKKGTFSGAKQAWVGGANLRTGGAVANSNRILSKMRSDFWYKQILLLFNYELCAYIKNKLILYKNSYFILLYFIIIYRIFYIFNYY